MDIHPQVLIGHWKEGYALDLHTISSLPHKDEEGNNILDGNGKIKWDTKYTPIGEEMNHLKYWNERHRAITIGVCAANFLKTNLPKWTIDNIIPIPPSDTTRAFQPVFEIVKHISKLSGLPIEFQLLKKLKPTSQLKEIDDPDARKEVLKDAFSIGNNSLSGKNILLFDDLYRSGETLNAVCDIIQNIGNAKNVYVLTVTKTRTKR